MFYIFTVCNYTAITLFYLYYFFSIKTFNEKKLYSILFHLFIADMLKQGGGEVPAWLSGKVFDS